MPPKKHKPWRPWNLRTHGVSWSFLDVWLRNREECRLRYVDGWRTKTIPHFLEFGQAFHHIMERGYRWYAGPPSLEACRKLGKGYFIRKEKAEGAVSSPDLVREQIELAAVVAYRYFEYYREDFDGKWHDLEKRFTYKYRYPDGLVVDINGVIDALHTDAADEFWVLDTKTKGEIDVAAICDEFPLNFQVNLYLFQQLSVGKRPAGAILNCVRRPGERMSKADNGSRLNLLSRISNKIRMDPDHYFKRPTYRVKEDEILEWKDRQLDPIMADVRLWAEGVTPTYVNPCGLYVQRRRSDFFPAMVQDDYTALMKRT